MNVIFHRSFNFGIQIMVTTQKARREFLGQPQHIMKHKHLAVVEADFLDETFNIPELPNGNRIVMGVELDPDDRPVAYHLWKQHPGDAAFWYIRRERVRIPAEEISHIYMSERSSQARGVARASQSESPSSMISIWRNRSRKQDSS